MSNLPPLTLADKPETPAPLISLAISVTVVPLAVIVVAALLIVIVKF